MLEILRYVTEAGEDVFGKWLAELRIDRLAAGNFGDCKPLKTGVWELRINYGPGYRVYYAMAGQTCLLLLCGGDKRKQTADIK